MRQRVVRIHHYSSSCTACDGKNHAMVVLLASTVDSSRVTVFRTICRSFDAEQPALIRVVHRRAWVICDAGECTRAARDVNRRIDRRVASDVDEIRTQIRARHEPIRADLPLKSQIPRLGVRKRKVVRLSQNPTVGHKLHVFVQLIREYVAAGNASIRIRQTARRARQRDAAAPRSCSRIALAEIRRQRDVTERI